MEYSQIVQQFPIWATIFPMIMTAAVFFAGRRSSKTRNILTVITTTVTFLLVLAMYPVIMAGEIIYYPIAELIPPFGLSFRVDVLGFGLALLSSFVWMLVSIYSLAYMDGKEYQNRYFSALILTLSGCIGIFLSGDLFSLFIFYELMSLVSYILIVHSETSEALKAGFKYLIVTIAGGLFLFFGIIITFEIGGSISLHEGGIITEVTNLSFLAYISFIIGFGMKAGMVPLHVWLPDAHPVAPSPASALLSGIMIKTGAYGLLRMVFHVFDYNIIVEANWHWILAVLSVITILLGSAVAIVQQDLKRRLAYSSVGQMGYILLGISIMTETAMIGDIFHIFSHAFMKSTLFLAAGVIISKTGKKKIDELKGIGYKMPLTMISFTIAALAMIGIPPLNGFLSKWALSLGALDANQPYYVVLLLLSSLMNAVYYLPIVNTAFFGKVDEEPKPDTGEQVKIGKFEAPLTMIMPVMVLGLSCLVLGLLPINLPYELSQEAARMLFENSF
ncbi:complex I subunit 5 family protein [Natranaerofaba carboxydovora]|uniref:complex I subunit 5 family protein n=1 Tax=Natranaerofaba carboxydovora TaxID=2742683 RepID=UPI001F13DB71|nr:monovalent cation/H+ antiporter subunit D family protein [Natranaerofaba carboxydovora]UMZ75309.1 Hydrogenase-4 component B [Natranaerofaba carboxydovora]